MRIGRYSVVSLLGHGAFGEVFHARLDGPMGFRKDVAIKRLHPHLVRGNAELVQALVDEARIGGLLRHPNIVEIHEFEQEEGAWFLAMEFVDGVTIQQLSALSLESGWRVPPAVTLEIIEQLCRGLAYAHAVTDSTGKPLRIVHRDLKPANLMISREGVVKIMDFGMAKAASNTRDNTASGTIKGTPSYMSPEQVHAKRAVTESSDIYSVGVMLYELLLGKRLFDGESAVAVMFAVIRGVTPEQIAELDAEVPGAGPVFARCVALDPDERWRSAVELGRAVSTLRERMEEPSHALRALSVALLQGPSRVDREELGRRSSGFNAYLDSVQTSFERLRATRSGSPPPLPPPPAGETLDLAQDPDATGAMADPDATRDVASPVPEVPPPAHDATRTFAGGLISVDPAPAAPAPPAPTAAPSAPAVAPAPPRAEPPAPAPVAGPPWPIYGAVAGAVLVASLLLVLRPWAGELPPAPPPPATLAPAVAEVEPAPPPPVQPVAEAPVASASAPPAEPPAAAASAPAGGKRPKAASASVETKPPEAAPTAPVGEGTILVKSSPWGRVSIDGTQVGQTPLRRKVPAGSHVVTVECGECAEAAKRSFNIDVDVDALQTVSAEFQP